ncbi:MAG: alpha/beta hydrolase [Chloroflexi bacterium]|nr:alpha/beta hydrolase [Chloroflexota bacterium]
MSVNPIPASQFDAAKGSETHTRADQIALAEAPQSLPKKRGFLRRLGMIAAVVVGLILAGTVYETVAEDADIRAYPPLGQMVDVGGYRLHINCTGTGSPTVVIDAGWGDWSLGWSQVQAELSNTTRVCTYDRAGMGYSESGPLPRNAEQFATELHTLLERAHITGPYVLVGHSLGGLPVRVFADKYPAGVSGVVLVDSMSPRQMVEPTQDIAPQTASQPNSIRLPFLLARIGVVRALAGPLGIVQEVSPDVQGAYAAFTVTPRNVQAWADEGASMQQSMAQADAVKTFGDLPLIVLTAGLNDYQGWPEMQVELLQLSSNSRQIVVENSGHAIHVQHPHTATAAIVSMVLQVR